jgi:hypothetical protein
MQTKTSGKYDESEGFNKPLFPSWLMKVDDVIGVVHLGV